MVWRPFTCVRPGQAQPDRDTRSRLNMLGWKLCGRPHLLGYGITDVSWDTLVVNISAREHPVSLAGPSSH